MLRKFITLIILAAFSFPTLVQAMGGHGMQHVIHAASSSGSHHSDDNEQFDAHEHSHSHDEFTHDGDSIQSQLLDSEPHYIGLLVAPNHHHELLALPQLVKAKPVLDKQQNDHALPTLWLSFAFGRDFSPDVPRRLSIRLPSSSQTLPVYLQTQRLRI